MLCKKMFELVETFSPVSSLVLKPFSPHDFSEYIYCNLYLEPEFYQDARNILDAIFF